ncbi:unknown [Crocosphaera subtropica ATCC 51142]|uniref:Uncharacterized protein n=1 Tax=Crocosphaera subtropica (strain ATCC 51142 / BH68) TaxID=43989 RepID=B1X144_CROS5|nr:unknown [Crocosphaera subtropica ATCC 51142]
MAIRGGSHKTLKFICLIGIKLLKCPYSLKFIVRNRRRQKQFCFIDTK